MRKQTFGDVKKFDEVVVEALGPVDGARFLAPGVDEDEARALGALLLERYPALVRQTPPLTIDGGDEVHVVLIQQTSDHVAVVTDEDSGTFYLSFGTDGTPKLQSFSAAIRERQSH